MNFSLFSAQLITTKDLDPDYVFLRELFKIHELTPAEQLNWIQHKVFIYDTASEYNIMIRKQSYENQVYGSERRKNRHYTVEQLPNFIRHFSLRDMPPEYTEARRYLKDFKGIGDWAAWKFCDLLERVMDHSIDFSRVDFRTAYDYPLRGLVRVGGYNDEYVSKLKSDDVYHPLMIKALREFPRHLMAPPHEDRFVDLQEFETCLCKYHSYLSGHYKIGQDTLHLIHRFKQENIPVPVDLLQLHSNPLNL